MAGEYDAIVLAGGRAARLSGQAKPQLSIGGATMLDRVLTAVRAAGTRIVVGPAQALPDDVVLAQEQPPGSGPVAGLAAGLPRTSSDVVVVLAADLPFLTAEVIERLVSELDRDAGVDGAVLVDENGRDQYLLGAWRVRALRSALAGLQPLPGRAMRELVGCLRVTRVSVAGPNEAPAPWTDVDTPADLDWARSRFRRNSGHSPENVRSEGPQK